MTFAIRLICVVLLMLPAFGQAAKDLTPKQLRAWQELGKPCLVLDVRSEVDFKRSHIENSISMPLTRLINVEIPLKFDVVIVDDDLSARTSRRAAAHIEETGAPEPYILKGGYTAWKRAELPTIQEKSVEGSPRAPKVTAEDLGEVIEKNNGKSAAGTTVTLLEYHRGKTKGLAVIPGATVVDSQDEAVKMTKATAHDGVVILADDGSGVALRRAGELLAQGRDVRVLAGGTHAWKLMKAKQKAKQDEEMKTAAAE